MRCGTPGTSWHGTAKPSICGRGVLYKSGVYAAKALCLTPGGLPAVRASEFSHANWALAQVGSIGRQKSAEGIVGAEAPKARTVPR